MTPPRDPADFDDPEVLDELDLDSEDAEHVEVEVDPEFEDLEDDDGYDDVDEDRYGF